MSRRRPVPPALLGPALVLALVVAVALAAAACTLPAEPDGAARCARVGTDDKNLRLCTKGQFDRCPVSWVDLSEAAFPLSSKNVVFAWGLGAGVESMGAV